MDQLLYDLRVSARSLLRRRAFVATATLTLALGIGATTALFSLVNGVLLRSLPYPEAERIVALFELEPGDVESEGGQLAHPNFRDVQAEVAALESATMYREQNLTLTGGDAAELVPGGQVTEDFFTVFRAAPVLGRAFTREEVRLGGGDVVVVSHGFWRERLGGSAAALGSSLEIGSRPHTIVGVAPEGFAFPNEARLWVPLQNDDEACGRDCVYMQAAGRLAPGATVAGAGEQLRTLGRRLEAAYPDSNTETTFAAFPLRDLVVGDVREALLVLLLAVGMVLLIACANVANLMLARGANRTGEVAVRAALGADRRRLMRQIMAESVVLSLFAGVAGLLLAYWGVDALKALSPGDIPRLEEVSVDRTALLFALGLVLLTPLVFGLAPALRLARVSLADVLRQGGRGESGSPRRGVGRSALLVAEVALSLMLLLGAGLLLRSFAAMQSVDPGFRAEGLATFRVTLPEARYPGTEDVAHAVDRLTRDLAALPGVSAVSPTVGLPLGVVRLVGSFARTDLPAPEPGESPAARLNYVGADYLSMMDIPVLSGRGFTDADVHGAQPVALVSRAAAAEYWPGENPVGKQLEMHIVLGYPEDQPRTIVGVVEDVRSTSLTEEPRPEIYTPYAQTAAAFPAFLLQTSLSPERLLADARPVVAAFDAKLPMIEPHALAADVDDELARPRFYFLLLTLFAVLALSLALVGIYGVVAFVVSARTREIGVRTALGATPGEVVGLVLRQGMGPALTGAALGLLGVFLGGRVVGSMLYGVQPQDPLTIVAATGLLLGAVAAACMIPARRAARISPVVALRNE